jgi:hypothetical protein
LVTDPKKRTQIESIPRAGMLKGIFGPKREDVTGG